jgi:hypothetical protein
VQRRTIILGISITALVVLLLFTLLSKRWWIARIRGRWVMNRYVWDEVVKRWMPEVSDFQDNALDRYTLGYLATTYINGEPGWYKQGEEPPAPPAFPPGRGPLGVGIVVNEPPTTPT